MVYTADEVSVHVDGNVEELLPAAGASEPAAKEEAVLRDSQHEEEEVMALGSSSSSKAEEAKEAKEEKVSTALGHSIDEGSRREDSASVYHWPIIIGVGVVMAVCVMSVAISWALGKVHKSWRAPESKGAVGKAKTLTPGMGISTRPSFTSP